MLSLLITILIVAIVISLAWWILGMLPLPPQVKQVITVVMVVICVLWLLFDVLLPLAGHPVWR